MNLKLLKNIENILRCPITKNKLILEKNKFKVENSTLEYQIRDGIIDLIPKLSHPIMGSYDIASSKYNSFFNNSHISTALSNFLIWGTINNSIYSNKVDTYFSDNFNGILLDVPIGTALFTIKKYLALKNAVIIGIDWSLGMLQIAKKLIDKYELNNVILIRADVRDLPLIDSEIDIILSMNGVHVFPQKQEAISEIVRVLKNKGQFAGCLYIKNKRLLTDLLVKKIYVKNKAFFPPFYNQNEFENLIRKSFYFKEIYPYKSILFFNAIKH